MKTRTAAVSSASLAALALLAVGVAPAASAAPAPASAAGGFQETIPLPDGFQPEGIAIDARGTAYFGSLADGDIYAADVRSGEGELIAEGPGSPSVGLAVDQRGRLFVAGGPAGDARVIDTRTGEVLASYQLSAGPTFINDVIVTRDAAWFTDSQQAQLYKLPLGPAGTLPAQDEVAALPFTGDFQLVPGFNANGIEVTPDGKGLLVIQSATATLFRVDPQSGVATAVDLGGVPLTNGDGLLVEGRTLYVVQNRLNLVGVVQLAADGFSGEYVDQLTNPAFDVPTTVASYGNGLYLPNARFGTPPTPDTEYSANRVER
ncbi:SMP-30/gluconolactonase/LRE family protein [Agromyces sp. ZXT2-6]|uniref:SMP-30/gluconolactonase/LRE family protein n=1 Tax=Agromyces sp. ZXT2-6 TaxID=3461153 RepID=UPI004054CA5A